MRTVETDVIVVGAGPAGLAAARSVHQSGKRALLVDDNPQPGGQIWRHDAAKGPAPGTLRWLPESTPRMVGSVVDARAPGTVFVETDDGPVAVTGASLVLATGAIERFLPFPGWTTPGVFGAGGLQALVKGGLQVDGRRVVVAGSGPLLLAVADLLRSRGARVRALVEQAPLSRMIPFATAVATRPGKARQALGLAARLLGVPRLHDAWPVRALGGDHLTALEVRTARGVRRVSCDLAAVGFGLVPETRLARLLGCALDDDHLRVDDQQQTTVPGVFAAGEPTGVGGLDKALVEGRIAGFCAAGKPEHARKLDSERNRERMFARALARAFALRAELRELPDDDTVVCRCEDIAYGSVRRCDSVRDAKLRTRAGMGVCQGRVCSTALEFLRDWPRDSIRSPILPATLGSLRAIGEFSTDHPKDPES